jgi:large conductance mechanosensitive channel
MAVGVVIGTAFGKIVSSLVSDIIMPPVSLLISDVHLTQWQWVLKQSVADQPAVIIAYGDFVQNIVDFVIIAFSIFMAVKAINSLKRREDETPTLPTVPTNEEKLLTEIRDLLKQRGAD